MRRKIFLLLSVILLIPWVGIAKCGAGSIYVYNKYPVYNNKGNIIVEFYDSHQYIAHGLNKRHPVYLKSNGRKIPVSIIAVFAGDFGVTQAILQADTSLLTTEQYVVQIDDINNKAFPPKRLNEAPKNWTSQPIRVTAAAPHYTGSFAITETKKTYEQYGCGPAAWVHFNVAMQDSIFLWAKTVVKDLATQTITTYVLPVENGTISVGHGMCAGAFKFISKGSYEVKFTLLSGSFEPKGPEQTLVITSPLIATTVK